MDDSDEEDEIFGDLGKPINSKHSNGVKEYHDYSSDDDEHKLFDSKLARTWYFVNYLIPNKLAVVHDIL